jgi:hypothetical protein
MAFVDTVLTTAQQQFNNIVPTTYEASKSYLDEEILKPEGQQDIQREMCMIMIIVMMIPNSQEIILKLDAAKLLIPLNSGKFCISWSEHWEFGKI